MAFSSGVEPLDRYFKTQARQDVRRRIASCFVLTDETVATPLGFYTLAAASVLLSELPDSIAKRLPRHPAVPAALLGRLAVDARHRGRGLGQHLLLDALARTLRSEIASFALLVDAKDETAAAFYAAHGFLPLAAGGRHMFLPVAEIATLFA